MPKFSYVVKDLEGKTYQNVADAENRAQLVKKLQSQKYFIVSMQEMATATTVAAAPAPAVAVKKKFHHKNIKLTDKLVFARQMATMLTAGVNLSRTLTVLLQQIESEKFFHSVRKVQKDVENGVSLSMAMSQHPKVFDQFWVSLIEVGEASGTMPTVLNKMSTHMENQAAFRSTVISGTIYPAILFFVCIAAVSFFALVVGPKFQQVFSSMKVDLPILTKMLLAFFAFVRGNFLMLFGTAAVVIFLLVRYIKTTYSGKSMFERFMLGLPGVGEIYRFALVERFTSQMSILIDAGVPILYALDITERLMDNNMCAEIVNKIKEGVKRGDMLTTPMAQSGFFPPMAIQMIVVGEETGQLDKMMGFVAKYYEDIVSEFMKRFSTVIEPVIILFMGVVIGVIVIAMFLPLLNISKMSGAAN